MRRLILCCSLAATTAIFPRPAPLRLRGGGQKSKTEEQPKTGKIWVTSTFTRDHVRFMSELAHYLGAYAGPRALSPPTIESIMVTMNSINTCPYCTGLHGQLARMASTKVDNRAPEVVYAVAFAEEAGRGTKVRAAYAKLVGTVGEGKALSARALCWALLWGKTTGNSINSVRGKLLAPGRWLELSPFDLLLFLYYGPFFLVIGVLNAILTKSPQVPAFVSAALGVVLWVPQAVHILFAGLLSLALRLLAAPFVGLSL
jgi:AhpD family alkylhydroperoxidase